jgi:hypothetical protein
LILIAARCASKSCFPSLTRSRKLKAMKMPILIVSMMILLSGTLGNAQAPVSPATDAVSAPQSPQKLSPELRRKLVESRQKVSQDPQYQQLLKAAQAAQARADEYFLARLKQAVAGDSQLVKLVDDLIRARQTLRAAAPSATAP